MSNPRTFQWSGSQLWRLSCKVDELLKLIDKTSRNTESESLLDQLTEIACSPVNSADNHSYGSTSVKEAQSYWAQSGQNSEYLAILATLFQFSANEFVRSSPPLSLGVTVSGYMSKN